MPSYRCLVVTKFEKPESSEKIKEEVAEVMDTLLAAGTAVFGWREPRPSPAREEGGASAPGVIGGQRERLSGSAHTHEDVLLLKDWNATTASQVEAVVLRNGDVHLLAPVAGEKPATVLQDGAELRKYDRDAWSHFLEAEARNRRDKLAVKVTFDDSDNVFQGDVP